ncbi:MAG: hypothetical protein JO079_12865 [Frankiaceae bacterium]|nr:hypothetical protein [Frankiaceae bacterium]MBV9369699.1 hypothetical protein [Frankiales bacterium]
MTDETETRPPAPDQQKNEPFGTSPETSAQAGSSSRARGDQGAAPGSSEVDDEAGAASMQRSAAPPVDGGVPTPGDSQGVAVPSVQAAAGTSEENGKVDGVSITSLAPPGKPDGEVDTRA